jgi:thymidylate kinase
MPDAEAGPGRPLAAALDLFRSLAAAEIPYCHWKSNEHLAAGRAGETDRDVHTGRSAALRGAELRADRGVKRIVAVPERAYPGVEDYHGFDCDTGRLLHLHLHHQLVLGEKSLKGYRLPWEQLALETRRLDPESGVYLIDPALELLVLAVRLALKVRSRDLVAARLGSPNLGGGALRELRWLAERLDDSRILQVATPLVGEPAARRLAGLTRVTPTAHQLLEFGQAAEPGLEEYRTYPAAQARHARWTREWRNRMGKAARRRGALRPVRHTLPQGGVLIAVVGSDGSGKSTVTREMARWLSWKLDVALLYFGSGAGPASLLRRPLLWAKALRRGRGPGQSRSRPSSPGLRQGEVAPGGGLRAVQGAWWAWSIATEKRARLAEARRARNLGMVVIGDRYPQSQIMGFTDGPRLRRWAEHRSRLLRGLAARELEVYRAADAAAPDLVIKLQVSPEVAAQRRPGSAVAGLSRRVDAVRQLRFPSATRVVEIDATQPLDRVLLEAKQAVWASL